MTDIAISVDGLGKAYRIGLKEDIPDSLVSAVTSWAKAPVRNFKRLRSLDTFKETDCEAEDVIWALRDVSFEVQRGEVLGIIGRNGAGKSTLLKVLSRITEPTTGRAVIRGRVSSLLEVGTGFHPELSGRENVYMNGTILGMTKREIDRKFDEIVDFSGVERFLDTPVKRYSSGMKVRLAFAVAAHLEPEILIIDEVLAVGDAEFQKRCLGKMQDLAHGGRTVLFVSHNMGAVKSLTTRCVYLRDGGIAGLGDTEKILDRYFGDFQTSNEFDAGSVARLRPEHGTKIRIVQITPRQPDGSGFRFGSDLVFEIELESRLQQNDLRVGVTVTGVMDDGIFTTISPKGIDTPREGRVSCSVSIQDSRLAPGAYKLSLAIVKGGLSEARVVYDIVRPGPAFSVSPASSNANQLFHWYRSFGAIVHPPACVACSAIGAPARPEIH